MPKLSLVQWVLAVLLATAVVIVFFVLVPGWWSTDA